MREREGGQGGREGARERDRHTLRHGGRKTAGREGRVPKDALGAQTAGLCQAEAAGAAAAGWRGL